MVPLERQVIECTTKQRQRPWPVACFAATHTFEGSVNRVTLSKVFWEPDLVIAQQATPT